MPLAFHGRFLALVEALERRFPVSQWRCGDVEVWPLARMDLYLDMYWSHATSEPPKRRLMPLRTLARLATPLRNLWKSRHDLGHWTVRPTAAHAIFLGDGVSLDLIDGAWQDRFCEPVIAEMERAGLRTFLMQGGELARLPWHRTTFSTNMLGAWGSIAAAAAPRTLMANHAEVWRWLAEQKVEAVSLEFSRLDRRARVVYATAGAFERVLRVVKPALAFVVTYYAGAGAAFLVACRRQRVLSIDLQHCPQNGAHKAYAWWQVPACGYATLPAVFWNWTALDAAHIQHWAGGLAQPWHRSIHGGHTQLAGYTGDSPRMDGWPADYERGTFEREILVALQPLGADASLWRHLRAQIESSPPSWRWWVRRHPASTPQQDGEHAELLSLRAPNVVVDGAALLPLPTLLSRMHALVSLASGAAVEASAFGVPAFFLSEEARAPFQSLIQSGGAHIVDPEQLNAAIESTAARSSQRPLWQAPPFGETLRQLTEWAEGYGRW